MLTETPVASARNRLNGAIDAIQRQAMRSDRDAAVLACEMLRAADRLIAGATSVIARGTLSAAGLPRSIVLQMDARRTSWEARMLGRVADTLATMPETTYAFEHGLVSWPQVRAITAAARRCGADDRAAVDTLVSRRATFDANADPDALVGEVEDLVDRLRADLADRREERAVEHGFVAIQPVLDGRASLYAEGDAESIATIANALDAHAGPPTDGSTRAQQRFDALVALASGAPAGRARPRVLATVDIATMARDERTASARLLTTLIGAPPRISPIGTQTLLCDAEVLPIIFEQGQPIAVGDASSPIPAKIRRAVEARDQGCRFPGCGAPIAWTDAHHILPRARGGRAEPANLVMLCRRCHRRIHKRGWSIDPEPDGTLIFRNRARRYASRPPPR